MPCGPDSGLTSLVQRIRLDGASRCFGARSGRCVPHSGSRRRCHWHIPPRVALPGRESATVTQSRRRGVAGWADCSSTPSAPSWPMPACPRIVSTTERIRSLYSPTANRLPTSPSISRTANTPLCEKVTGKSSVKNQTNPGNCSTWPTISANQKTSQTLNPIESLS